MAEGIKTTAHARMIATLKKGDKSPLSPIGDTGEKGAAVELAAEIVGSSPSAIGRASQVKKADPAL